MSPTCQTTMAAISTGLPSASLTLSRLVSKLRTLMLTRRRTVSGRTHQKPGRATVPTYRPKNCTTDVWPGGHDDQRGRHQDDDHRREPRPAALVEDRDDRPPHEAGQEEDGEPAADREGAALGDRDLDALVADGVTERGVDGLRGRPVGLCSWHPPPGE